MHLSQGNSLAPDVHSWLPPPLLHDVVGLNSRKFPFYWQLAIIIVCYSNYTANAFLQVNIKSLGEAAGLQAGDVINAVNGQDISLLRHKEAQEAIKKAGNNFMLTVTRGPTSAPVQHQPTTNAQQYQPNNWAPEVKPVGQMPTQPTAPSQTFTKTSLAANKQVSLKIWNQWPSLFLSLFVLIFWLFFVVFSLLLPLLNLSLGHSWPLLDHQSSWGLQILPRLGHPNYSDPKKWHKSQLHPVHPSLLTQVVCLVLLAITWSHWPTKKDWEEVFCPR